MEGMRIIDKSLDDNVVNQFEEQTASKNGFIMKDRRLNYNNESKQNKRTIFEDILVDEEMQPSHF